MNWRFCPHCETQLDEATQVCPACLYDGKAPVIRPERKSETSISERYRGTTFDVAPTAPQHPQSMSRTRSMVAVGLVAILGLYGSMVVYSDLQAHQDRPAGPSQPLHR